MAGATLDRERFLKILALAESDQDGEALAAIRKAAKMARAAGMSLGEAVDGGRDADSHSDFRTLRLEIELTTARATIVDLQRKLANGNDNAAYAKGFQKGQAYGSELAAAQLRQQAFQRVRELEAELEAYRPPLDWMDLAERFYSTFRRGAKAPFAKGVLYRASTNKLTPLDQTELRHFAENGRKPAKRRRRAGATEAQAEA